MQETVREKARVLVVDPIDVQALDELRRHFDVTVHIHPSSDEFPSLIENVEVVVLRSGARLDAALLEHAKNLKVIARAGVGTDNIDIKAATKKGIVVFKVPAESSRSVAEFSFGLILALARHIVSADCQVKQGIWKKNDLVGIELYKKTIGIVGLGNIGSEIARISKGFGMNIMASVQNANDERCRILDENGIKLVSLKEILTHADVVCLALPLTAQTENLISLPQLQQMKRTAILINISRSSIVNTEDLVEALNANLIKGVATDVLPNEKGRSPLDKFSNVVLTPHIGAMTEDAQYRIGQCISRGITLALDGREVPNRVR